MKNVQEIIARLNLLAESGQNEELLKQAERYIKEDKDFPLFYLFKANALRGLGEFDKAIAAYHEAIAKDPNDALARTSLGSLLYERGDYINALNACDSAILIDDKLPDSYVYSGNILVALGYPEQAVSAYHRAYTLDPTSIDLGEMIAVMYAQQGDLEKTTEVFFSLIQSNPNDDALQVKMAVALMYLLQNGASHKEVAKYAVTWRQLLPQNEYVNQVASALIENKVDFNPLTQQAIDALFTSYAPLYDFSMKVGESGMLEEVQKTINELYTTQELDICDLGCGTGLVGEVLKSKAKIAGLFGVDLCSSMLDQAYDKKIYDSIYHSENSTYLVQNPNKFDLIVAGNVFSYQNSLEEQILSIKNALKNGGYTVFTFRKNTINRKDILLYPPYYYLFTENYVKSVLEKAGLVIKEVKSLSLTERIDQSIEMMLCVAQKLS